jgi:tetratricopeptide (TPR) repeat protein
MKRPSQTILTAYCLLLTVYCLLATTAVHAQTTTDLTTLTVANQLYENGRYPEAAQTYEQLIAQGWQDTMVYYNLGNAYYRQADMGRAILNYERAARLAPRDADIRANLQLACEQIVDQITADDSTLNQLTVFARSWLTLNEMAVAAVAVWFLLTACWLVYRRRRTAVWRGLVLLTAVLLLGGIFSLGTRLYEESTRPVGIVVAAETAVSSGPGEQYPDQFTVHSGTAVHILEQRPQWTRITLPGDQLQGWVPVGVVTAVE